MALEITTDYIKLGSLLKGVNAVGSGGQAKQIIADGMVQVNGQVELRRGRKLYPGDRVSLGGREYTVEKAANRFSDGEMLLAGKVLSNILPNLPHGIPRIE
jgi:ribosome-associated protein